MVATIAFITQCFEQFNRDYFHNELPAIPIHLSDAKTFLGEFCYTKHRSLFGRVTYSNLCLRINKRVDLPVDLLEDVIIHEMIHYYIVHKRVKDTSAHGQEFRKIMNFINATYGRHISISHKGANNFSQQLYGKKTKPHAFCIVQLNTEKRAFKMVPYRQECIIRMHHLILKHFQPLSLQWFYSNDTYFNRYPTSNALRLYIVSNDIEPHLQNAIPIHCDSTTRAIDLPG